MKKWLVVLMCLGLFAALSAESSGCATVDNSEKSSAQVTKAKIKKVQLGDSKKSVRALLGKPESTDHMEVSGLKEDCWYYGVLAEKSWQFCFDNGKLDTKNRY